MKISEKILKYLPEESQMKAWGDENKLMYNKTSLRNGLKIQYNECQKSVEYLTKINKIDFIWAKTKNNRSSECYIKLV